MSIYANLTKGPGRQLYSERLHLLPESQIPSHLLKNVSNQLRQLQLVPKALEDIEAETTESFPVLVDPPQSQTYMPPVDPNKPLTAYELYGLRGRS